MADFVLDPALAADTVPLGKFVLCRVLLMNDARFPWTILVPERPGAVEIFDLSPSDRAALIEEIAELGEALRRALSPLKVNVAALGNQVRQLHVHVIARFATDPAWPRPIWSVPGPTEAYAIEAREALVHRIKAALPGLSNRA